MLLKSGVKRPRMINWEESQYYRRGKFNIHTERCVRRNLKVEHHKTFWKRQDRWTVTELLTYEVVGRTPEYMGWDAWAETEWSGAYWTFDNKEEAYEFIRNNT